MDPVTILLIISAVISALGALGVSAFAIIFANTSSAEIIDKMCAARYWIMDYSEPFLSFVGMIGCLLCAYNLIHQAFEIADDEKAGGFGSTQITDIIRPFILLICIYISPTIIKLTDSVCRTVTIATTSLILEESSGELRDVSDLNTLKIEYQGLIDNIRKEAKYDEENRAPSSSDDNSDYIAASRKYWAQQADLFEMEYRRIINSGKKDTEKITELTGLINQMRNYISSNHISDIDDTTTPLNPANPEPKRAAPKMNNIIKSIERVINPISSGLPHILTSITKILLDIFRLMFIIMAQVYLCILALLFPIILCVSIVGVWRDNIKNFFPRYFNLWFWQVIVGVLMALYNILEAVFSLYFNTDIIIFVLALSFIQLIKKTPDIANMIVGYVAGHSDSLGPGRESDVIISQGTGAIKSGANSASSKLGNLIKK